MYTTNANSFHLSLQYFYYIFLRLICDARHNGQPFRTWFVVQPLPSHQLIPEIISGFAPMRLGTTIGRARPQKSDFNFDAHTCSMPLKAASGLCQKTVQGCWVHIACHYCQFRRCTISRRTGGTTSASVNWWKLKFLALTLGKIMPCNVVLNFCRPPGEYGHPDAALALPADGMINADENT